MRPILHGDLTLAAKVLLGVPMAERGGRMRQMLERASAADSYFKRFKKGHPNWGNGSLMAVAMRYDMAAEPFLDDPEYCQCWVVVFESIIAWRSERAAFSRAHKKRKWQWLDQDQGA